MNKDPVSRARIYALCLVLAIALGCSRSRTTRFYTLNALTEPPTEWDALRAERPLAIGLGPIVLPEYLDRPQIATRVSTNEVRFAEFDRWAGPLGENLLHVLADDLATLLGTGPVALYPWRSTTPIDYRVEIRLTRFEGKPGEDVLLQGRWAILTPDRKNTLFSRTSTVREAVNGKAYEDLVSAQSRALAALSREIAQALGSLTRVSGQSDERLGTGDPP